MAGFPYITDPDGGVVLYTSQQVINGASVGGDLSGTLPNPTVITTHLNSPLPLAQGGTANSTGQPSGTAGGDLTGTYPNPTVTKLETVAVNASTIFDATASNAVPLATFKNTTSVAPNGCTIKMLGDGASTPAKYIQVFGGNFYVVNNALNHWLFKLDDVGNLNIGQDIPRVSINSSGFCQLPTTIATLGSNQGLTTSFVAYLSITLSQAGTWLISFSMGMGSLTAGDQVACVVNDNATSIFAQGDCARSDGVALMTGTFIYTISSATTIFMYGINVTAARGNVFAKDTITSTATTTWLDAVQVA